MSRFVSRNDLLTPAQASRVTGLTAETIRAYMRRDYIPYEVSTVGRRKVRRIRRSVALKLVEEATS